MSGYGYDVRVLNMKVPIAGKVRGQEDFVWLNFRLHVPDLSMHHVPILDDSLYRF